MMLRRLLRKTSFVVFLVFVLIVMVFTVFGKTIRNYYSPHVYVTSVSTQLIEENGERYIRHVLPLDCLIVDEITNEPSLYYVEKKDNYGETVFVAVKNINIKTNITDGIHIEITKGDWVNKNFIYKTDRSFKEGDRVVVVKSED